MNSIAVKVAIKFDENTTTLVTANQDEIILKMGYQALIDQYINGDLPTAYETEMVIMIIEDEIARQHAKLPVISSLVTDADQIRIMANYWQSGHSITTAQVEMLFNQYADIISGSPKRQPNLPDTLSFIMVLVILRELLHHLNIAGVEVI